MDIISFLFLPQNILIIAGLIFIGFLIYTFVNIKNKSKTKPISREEIERMKFIERMKVNTNQSTTKWFYRGKDMLGQIINFRTFVTTGNPHNHLIAEMVIRPSIKILFLQFVNPLAKEQAFQINLGLWEKEKGLSEPNFIEDKDKMIMPKWISFNYYFGIYYDITIAREHQDIILQKDLALTDLHAEKSVDFAKAQELATIGYVPYAHEMGMKEKDIQYEIARKKGEQQSI